MTPLRRPEKEIKDKKEIETILRETEIGRLATSNDNQPYVVPLTYAYHDGKIIIHGAKKGKKMDNISTNPRVCFQADQSQIIPSDSPCDYTYRYRSVIADGTARTIRDPAERARALRLLVEKYAPESGERITTELIDAYDDMAVIEITIDTMVGKRSPA